MSKLSTVKTVNPSEYSRNGDVTLMEKIIHRVKNTNKSSSKVSLNRSKKHNDKMPPSRCDQQLITTGNTTTTTTATDSATTEQQPQQHHQQQQVTNSDNKITLKNEVERNYLVENNFMYIDDDDDDDDDESVDNDDVQGNLHNKVVKVNKIQMETNNNNNECIKSSYNNNMNKNIMKNDDATNVTTHQIITNNNNSSKGNKNSNMKMMMITDNNITKKTENCNEVSIKSGGSSSINNLLNGRKLKQQISLCITEDSECDRQQNHNHHQQQQQQQEQHIICEGKVSEGIKRRQKENERVHDVVYDKLKNKQQIRRRQPTMVVDDDDGNIAVVVVEGQTNICGNGRKNDDISINSHQCNTNKNDVETRSQMNTKSVAPVAPSRSTSILRTANCDIKNQMRGKPLPVVKTTANHNTNHNNNVNKNITTNVVDLSVLDNLNDCENLDVLISDPDADPYAAMEMYLEKIKNEITEVFEQFQINEHHQLDTDKNQKTPKINSSQLSSSCSTTSIAPIKLQTTLTDVTEIKSPPPQSLLQQQQHKPTMTPNLTTTPNHSNNSTPLNSSNNSSNPQFGKYKTQRSGDDWAVDIMDELNNLVKNELKNLKRNEELLADQILMSTDNYKSSSNNECNSDTPKSFNSTVGDSRKPPAGKNPRIIRNLECNPNDTSQFVLKINEDYLKSQTNDEVGATMKKESASTQTSPFLGNQKKIAKWNSEESMVRSTGTTDEDNKSTSSSACEEGSAVLSSGKSGNSLDSSELENIESGIGTASPPKDMDSWSHSLSSHNTSLNITPISNDRIHWIRRENVTTQNNPSIIRTLKTNRSPSSQSDPDHLDVLGSYDGDNTDDDFHYAEQQKSYDENQIEDDCGKSGESLYGTNSSSSSNHHKNYDDDFDVVVYRDKSSSTSLPTNHLHKKVFSFPLTQNGKPHSNSLPGKSHHQNGRIPVVVKQRPYCLTIDQEPFQSNSTNMFELPSPSSASLHSGHGNLLVQELCTKSNSAPLLLKKDKRRDEFVEQKTNLRYSRSQSDRLLAEIEAIEACKWLRAAGFPQYAQMYEDLQFPIDLSNVAKDHSFLEHDPLQSLYRRLVVLNRCATMRLDGTHKHGNNDDSEDDSYALSENWTFQPNIRRWSRVGDQLGIPVGLSIPQTTLNSGLKLKHDDLNTIDSRESSPEPRNMDTLGIPGQPFELGGIVGSVGPDDQGNEPIRFRRTGSERLKDGAKALLRRVESIKSRRKKRHNRDGVVISGPQILDIPDMNQRMNDLKCIDVLGAVSNPTSPMSPSPMSLNSPSPSRSPVRTSHELKINTTKDGRLSPSRLSSKHNYLPKSKERQSHSNRTSPLHFFAQHSNFNLLKDTKSGDDSSSYCSDSGSLDSESVKERRKKPSRTKRFLQRGSKVEDAGALSDSECHHVSRKKKYLKDANSNNTEQKPITITRGGSLNLGKDPKRIREKLQQRSTRSKSLMRKQGKQYGLNVESDADDVTLRNKNPVVRWHSFQSNERTDFAFRRQSLVARYSERPVDDIPIAAMSCGQIQVLRKLALVTLTGYMERHCPTHRTGWNWELPKFIKKIKNSGYKDKNVFGVPLLLVSQRTGQTLPKSIFAAIKWLKLNALDHVGIFRKSGGQPRIQKLKAVVETFDSDSMAMYDGQQGYDVADMVKQYFRELPECLMTNKMSETFIAIFQHLPAEIRMEAVYAAIVLLPDEHREALNYLLEFLFEVSEHSKENRMTASNLGMCFGPTLLNTISGNGLASPKRRKGTGVPDARELNETLASQNCLTFLIQNYRQIFTVSKERMLKCNFGYMEESKPVTLAQLGEGLQVQNWKGYLCECTSATMREGREKSRGWISSTSFDPNVEIAYKKVGDNHPLRLWRCTTEVEAPPAEVLNLILKERHAWDNRLLKWRLIEQLDNRSEIIQYISGDQNVTDYCVLRTWRSDLPRGACVIVETSIEHPDAKLVLVGGVRGVVLASRYLIEPCGSGKSRIMHLARVDMKGRSPEWYNKCYGHISSQYLTKIRNSFKQHIAEGPESKV